jgi:hypothetical protein
MSCTISKELADFLNLNYSQNGERISRVKITRFIDSYIETNGLRDHRTIKPDEKLKNLLNCGDNEVTFANLQSYIAPHIICMNCMNVNVNAVAVVMILSPPPPSAPPLSPECAYAVFPEDELPESPPKPLFPAVAASAQEKSAPVCVYAVFPEDELPDTLPYKPIYFNHALLHAVGVYRQVGPWTWDTSRYHIDTHRQLPSPCLPDRAYRIKNQWGFGVN